MPCIRSNYRLYLRDGLEGTWQEMAMPCCLTLLSRRRRFDRVVNLTLNYSGADKSLARPGRKRATATGDFEFHISYL